MVHELEKLREILSYDPETGSFTWLVSRGRNAWPGKIAGRPNKSGYTHICALQKEYLAHRLAWYFTYGEWPDQDVDHINGQVTDNRIANLRKASHTQNMVNCKVKKNSFTGLKGVSPHENKWIARIRVGGVRRNLGRFDTKEQAYEAYCKASTELHGEFGRT